MEQSVKNRTLRKKLVKFESKQTFHKELLKSEEKVLF